MLKIYRRYRLAIVNIVYWFLLLYIVAALVWWFIALGSQSQKMAAYELAQVRSTIDSTSALSAFNQAIRQVSYHQKMRSVEFMGEGTVFLVVILICAIFVYRAVRRQIRLSNQQQNFMMAVTHELKTPIAVAKLNLETLIKRTLTPAQQSKLILSALGETERLNQLSNNILLAAQLEDSGYVAARESISLSLLVSRAVEAFSGRFPGRIFEADVDPDIDMEGDALLLELAVNNLIENACKYSPKESPIRIRLARSPKEVVLKIKDLGEGIPDSEKALIFRKFYRVGREETRKTKGTGLGLYLSRAIIRKHKGQLSVADNEPQGSIFTITFYT
jgi:two-component system, OmpR family, sensor histidine kinase CiaH